MLGTKEYRTVVKHPETLAGTKSVSRGKGQTDRQTEVSKLSVDVIGPSAFALD